MGREFGGAGPSGLRSTTRKTRFGFRRVLRTYSVPLSVKPSVPPAIRRAPAVPSASFLCPGCGQKEFKRWPWGWDAHAAHACRGLSRDRSRKAKGRSSGVGLRTTSSTEMSTPELGADALAVLCDDVAEARGSSVAFAVRNNMADITIPTFEKFHRAVQSYSGKTVIFRGVRRIDGCPENRTL